MTIFLAEPAVFLFYNGIIFVSLLSAYGINYRKKIFFIIPQGACSKKKPNNNTYWFRKMLIKGQAEPAGA